jgi:hypothetical protein
MESCPTFTHIGGKVFIVSHFHPPFMMKAMQNNEKRATQGNFFGK